ncbi:MAG: DUF3862 domain-containing protein [Coleofasciculus sp. B1-GNL1-01]|uniref:DUF3862 domain-containing protein n=1 Tax=Coleofasciculus sp. B1-GNL1-01 TaxID=3068484 RepID=UPI0033006F1E
MQSLGKTTLWVLSVLFILLGLVFFATNLSAALMALLIGVVLLPPMAQFIDYPPFKVIRWVIAGAAFGLFVAFVPPSENPVQPPQASPTPRLQRPSPSPTQRLTLEAFNQIKAGMTYEQVIEILGEGEEISRVEIPGTPTTVMYQWQTGLRSVNATFQDNKLISKAQFNLD